MGSQNNAVNGLCRTVELPVMATLLPSSAPSMLTFWPTLIVRSGPRTVPTKADADRIYAHAAAVWADDNLRDPKQPRIPFLGPFTWKLPFAVEPVLRLVLTLGGMEKATVVPNVEVSGEGRRRLATVKRCAQLHTPP